MGFSMFSQKHITVTVFAIAYVLVAAYGVYLYVNMVKTQPESSSTQQFSQAKQPLRLNKENQRATLTNLFGVAPKSVKEMKNTQWQLKGIIFSEGNQKLIILNIGKEDKILKEGDKINSDTVIEKIEKDRVVFRKNGELHMLPIFKPEQVLQTVKPATKPMPNSNAQRIRRDASGAWQNLQGLRESQGKAPRNPSHMMP